MTKTTIGGLIAGLALALAASSNFGCSGGGGVIEDLCHRGVECGLDATYGECVDYMEECTGELTPDMRADWEDEIEECLERSTCDGAIGCYNQVPWC